MTTRKFGQTVCALGVGLFLCMSRMVASAEEIVEEPVQVDEQIDEQADEQTAEEKIFEEVLPDILAEESVDEGIIDENVLLNTGASDHDTIEEAILNDSPTSGTCGPNLTWSLSDDGTVLTITGTGQMNDYNARTNAAPWYDYRYSGRISRVVLPNGLTSIGDYAFYYCSSLMGITIPNSVASIGESAFYGCTSLTSIVIPNSVTSMGSSVFSGCTSLESVTIPNSVMDIGESNFFGCTGLESITIPNSVASIGSRAFSGCTGLESITISNSVSSIGYFAFSGCTGLESITIPNSVVSIDTSAFSGCTGLERIIIPDSVTNISSQAFKDCSSLESITIPNVTYISNSTFEGCTGLTSVTLDSVTSIGSSAFSGCTNLTELNMYGALNQINTKILSGCSSLKRINGWSVNYTIATIPSRAFWGASALTELYIPQRVNTIKDYAFWGCSSLTKVGIPAACTKIETGAYRDCPITDVYYEGSQEQWNEVSIGYYNEPLTNARIHFNSTDIYPAVDISGVALNKTAMNLVVGSTVQLVATVRQQKAGKRDVTWTSDDTKVATVDENGKVTALSEGSTYIRVQTVDGSSSSRCRVEVFAAGPDVTGVVLNKSEMELAVGNTGQLVATVQPENAGIKDVTWTSDNTNVATVDENGKVTALSEGSTYIRVTTVDGFFSAKCLVKVPATDPVVTFVTRMYRVALGRDPDAKGLNSWVNDLKSGRKKGADIAQGFYMSPEIFKNNPTSEEYVELAYLGMMNRPSDAGGKADWVDALNNGVTCNAIIKGFVGSQEFQNLCAEYGIQAGKVTVTEPRDQNVGVTKFVARLYTQALGRPYDVDGLNDWTAQINANPSKENILNISTNGFLNSQEFLSKGLSNEEFVRVLYWTFLGREADQGGLNDWLNRLNNGASRDEIAAGFANSPEFAIIMARYGL